MIQIFLAAIVAFLVGTSAWADSGEVIFSGAPGVADKIVIPHQADIEKAAGVKIVVTSNSSEDGLENLFKGQSQIAMISVPMDEVMKKVAPKAKENNVSEFNLFTFNLGAAKEENNVQHLGLVVQGVPSGDIKKVLDAVSKYHL